MGVRRPPGSRGSFLRDLSKGSFLEGSIGFRVSDLGVEGLRVKECSI